MKEDKIPHVRKLLALNIISTEKLSQKQVVKVPGL